MNKWERVLQVYEALPVKEFGEGVYYYEGSYCAVGALDPEEAKALKGAGYMGISHECLRYWREKLAEKYGLSTLDLHGLQAINDRAPVLSKAARYEDVIAAVRRWSEKLRRTSQDP